MRILVIEDEPQLARHVSRALTRRGHDVTQRGDGLMGLSAAREMSPDLIVLDLNLPGLDGFDLLGQLKLARMDSRVLIVTARGELEHRLRGLNGGADDYLTKPFAMEELIARVEALGRRWVVSRDTVLLEVGGLRMDVVLRRVTRLGQAVALSPREFDVLRVLMQEPSRVFSRTELCERVWQRDYEYDTRTVEIFITRLRKKLEDGPEPSVIQTIRGVGYTLRVAGVGSEREAE